MPQPMLRTDRLVLEPLADRTWSSRSSSTRTPRCCATCPRGPTPPTRRGPGTPSGWSAAARSTAWACGWGSSTTGGARDSSSFVGLYMLTPPHGPSQPKMPGLADLGYRIRRDRWRQGFAKRGLSRAAASRLRDRRPGPGDRADHGGQRRLPRDHGLGRPDLRAVLHRASTTSRCPARRRARSSTRSAARSGAREVRPGPRRRGARPRPPRSTPPARPVGRTARGR